jgi:hypothetical protein
MISAWLDREERTPLEHFFGFVGNMAGSME